MYSEPGESQAWLYVMEYYYILPFIASDMLICLYSPLSLLFIQECNISVLLVVMICK